MELYIETVRKAFRDSSVRYLRAQSSVTKGGSLSLCLSLFLASNARGGNKKRLSSFRRVVSASTVEASFRTNICHSTTTLLRASGCPPPPLRPFVSPLLFLRGGVYFAQIQFACLRTRPTLRSTRIPSALACLIDIPRDFRSTFISNLCSKLPRNRSIDDTFRREISRFIL